MNRSRREFLKQSGVGGIGLLSFTVAGCERELTPAAARVEAIPFRVLGPHEAATLEALGEILLPGSAAAGLAHYIDHQLGAAPPESMLMIKYLGVKPPFAPFYKSGLASLETAAVALFDRPFTDLPPSEAANLVGRLAAGDVPDWEGPPPGLFYFVLRSDSVDVYYGTREGFAKLGVPYMAHIEPPGRWGE